MLFQLISDFVHVFIPFLLKKERHLNTCKTHGWTLRFVQFDAKHRGGAPKKSNQCKTHVNKRLAIF
nr:MAG TPA: hypothetical protein [Caudoviricetes sp.]